MLVLVLIFAGVLLGTIMFARLVLSPDAAALVERGITGGVYLMGKYALIGLALSIIYLVWRASYATEMP